VLSPLGLLGLAQREKRRWRRRRQRDWEEYDDATLPGGDDDFSCALASCAPTEASAPAVDVESLLETARADPC